MVTSVSGAPEVSFPNRFHAAVAMPVEQFVNPAAADPVSACCFRDRKALDSDSQQDDFEPCRDTRHPYLHQGKALDPSGPELSCASGDNQPGPVTGFEAKHDRKGRTEH